MVKIETRTGCCKYCKKADTCILSAIYPLVEKMGYKDSQMKLDIYVAVETVLNDKYRISCTASTDSCPYCIQHDDSGCPKD